MSSGLVVGICGSEGGVWQFLAREGNHFRACFFPVTSSVIVYLFVVCE